MYYVAKKDPELLILFPGRQAFVPLSPMFSLKTTILWDSSLTCPLTLQAFLGKILSACGYDPSIDNFHAPCSEWFSFWSWDSYLTTSKTSLCSVSEPKLSSLSKMSLPYCSCYPYHIPVPQIRSCVLFMSKLLWQTVKDFQ